MFNVSADHSWFGLLEVALLVLGSACTAIITAVLGARLQNKKNGPTQEAVAQIQQQVVNGHIAENLRDQIDMIRDSVHMVHDQLSTHTRAIQRIEARLEKPRRPE
jgi:TolA-binding protein